MMELSSPTTGPLQLHTLRARRKMAFVSGSGLHWGETVLAPTSLIGTCLRNARHAAIATMTNSNDTSRQGVFHVER